MKASVSIVESGLLTSIQDGGRAGSRHLGVPRAGATDRYSLALANTAIGNPSNAAGLEATLLGPTLRFERDMMFAVGGADMKPTLNSAQVERWTAITAKAGDVLALGRAEIGARSYIAFQGGLQGSEFLGSVATYVPAQIGGINGEALKAGDTLTTLDVTKYGPKEIPRTAIPALAHDFILRAIVGPDEHLIDPQSIDRFFTSAYKIDRRAGRMGAKLVGEKVALINKTPMLSSAVFPGTIQAPPDGAPFLLLSDAQTLGGYPRLAQIIAADIWLAAQMRPDDKVWFHKTNAEEAREIASQKHAFIADLMPDFSFY